jgi:hypothetical protein
MWTDQCEEAVHGVAGCLFHTTHFHHEMTIALGQTTVVLQQRLLRLLQLFDAFVLYKWYRLHLYSALSTVLSGIRPLQNKWRIKGAVLLTYQFCLAYGQFANGRFGLD